LRFRCIPSYTQYVETCGNLVAWPSVGTKRDKRFLVFNSAWFVGTQTAPSASGPLRQRPPATPQSDSKEPRNGFRPRPKASIQAPKPRGKANSISFFADRLDVNTHSSTSKSLFQCTTVDSGRIISSKSFPTLLHGIRPVFWQLALPTAGARAGCPQHPIVMDMQKSRGFRLACHHSYR